MSFEFKLDNEKVDKRTFLTETNGKPINIEKIGKLFDNQMFKREQFIVRLSAEDLGLETKIYISPVVKDKEDEILYFGTKSFLNPLIVYALTGENKNTGVTVSLSTIREALEDTTFTITYDMEGKYPKITGVE